jgi:hypothetical protein
MERGSPDLQFYSCILVNLNLKITRVFETGGVVSHYIIIIIIIIIIMLIMITMVMEMILMIK